MSEFIQLVCGLMMLMDPSSRVRDAGQEYLNKAPITYEIMRYVYRKEGRQDPELYIRLKVIAWNKYQKLEDRPHKREDFIAEMDTMSDEEVKLQDSLFVGEIE